MSTDTLTARMRAFVAGRHDDDAESAASAFLAVVTKKDLHPLVAHAFRDLIRREVRLLEVEVIAAGGSERRGESLDASLAALLNEPYRIGDGAVRRFGAMTADEHRTRIALLDGQMAGLIRSRQLHEEAIAVIEARGVSSLDDLTVRKAA